MEMYVDDARLDQQPAGGELLEETLRQIQDNVCQPGRLVVAVRCDGKDVPGGELTKALQKPTSDFEQIEIFTGTPSDLVSDAMNEAAESLRQTEGACQEIASRINEGRVQEGISALAECVAAWQQIQDAVGKSLQMLQIDVSEISIRDEPLEDVIRKPAGVLAQIKQALQAQDHVLLADILQYEFSQVVQQWQMIVARLRQEAEDQSEPVS